MYGEYPLYWEVATHEDAIEALNEKIQAMQADCHANQWQAVGVRRKNLFSRAQAEFHERKDRFPSDETPNRQDQIAFCHPSKVDFKMVQE